MSKQHLVRNIEKITKAIPAHRAELKSLFNGFQNILMEEDSDGIDIIENMVNQISLYI